MPGHRFLWEYNCRTWYAFEHNKILKRLVLILIPISSCVKSNSTAVGEEWRMLSSSNWALGVKLEIESWLHRLANSHFDCGPFKVWFHSWNDWDEFNLEQKSTLQLTYRLSWPYCVRLQHSLQVIWLGNGTGTSNKLWLWNCWKHCCSFT